MTFWHLKEESAAKLPNMKKKKTFSIKTVHQATSFMKTMAKELGFDLLPPPP